MFDIDYNKLISDLLPWFHRRPVLLAWLKVLVSPVVSLYNDFIQFRETNVFSASLTGQVISLEFMLNKVFYGDGTLRHIYISDGERLLPPYVFNKEENKVLFLFNSNETHDPVYMYRIGETTGYDFIVWVPTSLVFDAAYMRGLIEKHKAAGFQFQIKTY